VSRGEMVRAFVAVELSAAARQSVSECMRALRVKLGDAVRWVAEENLHLTLHFLGQVALTQLEAAAQALAPLCAQTRPFLASVRGLGAFPSVRRARVLWCGVGLGGPDLVNLAARLRPVLESVFPTLEKGDFHPHITIGRARRQPLSLSQASGVEWPEEGPREVELTVDQVAVMRSDLRPSGPVYTRLWNLPLGEAGEGRHLRQRAGASTSAEEGAGGTDLKEVL